MTSAERLRDLNEVIPRDIPHPSGMDLDESWSFTHREQFAILVLRNALPQIIALVEAAEQLPEFFYDGDGRAQSFVPLLAALDEQLTGGSATEPEAPTPR